MTEDTELLRKLSDQMVRQNQLLERSIKLQLSWRLRITQGLIFGFASFVGATVLVSLFVYFLNAIGTFKPLSPMVDELTTNLKTGGLRAPLNTDVPKRLEDKLNEEGTVEGAVEGAVEGEEIATEQPETSGS